LLTEVSARGYLALLFPGRAVAAPLQARNPACKALYFDSSVPHRNRIATLNNDVAGTAEEQGTNLVETQITPPTLGDMTENVGQASVISTVREEFKLPPEFGSSRINETASIETFLKRPIKLADYSLSAANTVTSFTKIAHPSGVVTNAIRADKLKGILFFRATSVFTLFVNANKFQAGRYVLAHIPTGGSNQTIYGDDWYVQHRFTMFQISQLPHVEIDINCDTQVSLRVPFSSVETDYNTYSTNGKTNVGYIVLIPYSALSTGATGSSTAAASLFHHFDDVVINASTIPQSAKWKPSGKKASVTSDEQKASGLGPISGALSHLSRAATSLGTIPLLTPFMGPASWWLDLTSGVAKQLGWSRPTDLAPPNSVFRRVMPGLANADTSDNSQVLAPFCSNEIAMVKGISVDEDELSFEYIKSIPAYFARFSVSTADVSGTNVWSVWVRPDRYSDTNVDAGVTVRSHTPISYLAKFFSQWRGSIILNFKIVKTSFHSGRLMFAYVPFDAEYATPAASIDNMNYVNRSIIDIRDGNEISLEIPYTSAKSWLKYGEASGLVYVYVLDELVAPASVATSIEIVVEAKGGPDLEFSVPQSRYDEPYIPTAPQSADWEPMSCKLVESNIGTTDVKVSNVFSALTVGESVRSLRTFLKRPSMLYQTAGAWPMLNHENIITPTISVCRNVAAAASRPSETPDIYSHLGSIYMYSRGSIRFKEIRFSDVATATGAEKYAIAVQHYNTAFTNDAIISGTVLVNAHEYNNMSVAYSQDDIGGVQLQVPQYMPTHSRNNAEWQNNAATPVSIANTHGPYAYTHLVRHAGGGTDDYCQRFRSGGDDASFHGFVSIPPMYEPSF